MVRGHELLAPSNSQFFKRDENCFVPSGWNVPGVEQDIKNIGILLEKIRETACKWTPVREVSA